MGKVTWPRHYKDQDKQDAGLITDELRRLGINESQLARQSSISGTAVNQILSGKYPSPPGAQLRVMINALTILEARNRSAGRLPFVETSVWGLVKFVCDEARAKADSDGIGLVTGYVGVGKTTALHHYADGDPSVVYLRGSAGMTKSDLLARLCEMLDLTTLRRTTISRKQSQIMSALRGSSKLIILDEASRPHGSCLEVLRDISDDTQTALVFAGREFLYERLKDPGGRFGEISSRILSWFPPVKALKEEDVRALIKAGLPDMSGKDLIEMTYQCSENNARLLAHLIDKIDASGLNYKKGSTQQLSPEVISKIYTDHVRPRVPIWRRHGAPN